jgi:hypothetical protein
MPIPMDTTPFHENFRRTRRGLWLLAAAATGGVAGAAWPRAALLGHWLYWSHDLFPDDAGPADSAWPGFGLAAWAAVAAVVLLAVLGEVRKRPRQPVGRSAAWLVLVGALAVLSADIFGQMATRVRFPMDLLLWSESSFLQDMIKLNKGHCPYSPPDRNNSFVYNPGAPMVTWAVSRLCGRYGDLAFGRWIQVAAALLACGLAWLAARALAEPSTPAGGEGDTPTAGLAPAAGWGVALFVLTAGLNPVTSPFVDLLHTDALALLGCAGGLAALAFRWRVAPGRWLWLAAPVPMLALLVKQTGSVVWLGMIVGVVIQERTLRPALRFALASGLPLAALALVLTVWSRGWWTFWTVTVLAKQPMNVPAGVRTNAAVILPLGPLALACAGWLAWGLRRPVDDRGRAFVSTLVYTGLLAASAAVTTFKVGTCGCNHWGPAALGLVALTAAVVRRLVAFGLDPLCRRAAVLVPVGLLVAAALLHRTARPLPGAEEYRAAALLRQTFAQTDPARTLLDHGSLLYLERGVLPIDRCNSVLELSLGGVRTVDPVVDRIMDKKYQRIMIHDEWGLHWYNQVSCAVMIAYDLKARLPGSRRRSIVSYLLSDLLVFEPRSDEVRRQQPPFVLTTEPAVGVTTGRIPDDVRVRFSRPMDPATVTPHSIYVMGQKGNQPVPIGPAKVHYEAETRTAVITPTARLKPGIYWIVMTDAVRDLRGQSFWPGWYCGWFEVERFLWYGYARRSASAEQALSQLMWRTSARDLSTAHDSQARRPAPSRTRR